MFSGDFVKLTNAATVSGNQHAAANGGDAWTDQELLLLLEGVEMYDDDWSAIEEHVGTRSAQQCIRKFLELPIEDPYLEGEGDMGAMRYARVPFEQADNPVMSVVAFLAGVVGPGVAAEAAKTALGELTKGEEKESKVPDSGKEKEGEKATTEAEGEEKTSEDDKMDEDKAPSGQSTSQQPANAEPSSSKATTPAPGVESTSNDVQPSTSTAEKSVPGVPHSKVVRAANLALKSSAKAASSLASAEEANIRSTLAAVIKLQLTKLELKMSQFEELEDLLEEERRALEGARLALVSERMTLRKTLDNVRGELSKHAQSQAAGGPGNVQGVVAAVSQANMGTSNQGTRAQEVPQGGTAMEGDGGPVSGGNVVALS